jgi:radical SAM protein with 4Fe4S-binding SPASM domain
MTELKKANLSRLGLILDGGTAQSHDHISGVAGSFAHTLEAMKWANECRLPLQIHTNVRRRNLPELEHIASVLKSFRIGGWSISFPVPQPGEFLHDLPSAGEFEEAFAVIYQLAQDLPFKVKTVEAPHYRRFVLQQRSRVRAGASGLVVFPSVESGIPGVLPINEGRASLFISSTGDIYPDKALRICAGNVRYHKLADVYGNAPLFDSLRDLSNLKGKCSDCEFKDLCGGSRARAWAVTGDVFGEEPCCSYLPVAARKVG